MYRRAIASIDLQVTAPLHWRKGKESMCSRSFIGNITLIALGLEQTMLLYF
jgi:hypothetical protein